MNGIFSLIEATTIVWSVSLCSYQFLIWNNNREISEHMMKQSKIHTWYRKLRKQCRRFQRIYLFVPGNQQNKTLLAPLIFKLI